MELTDRVCYRYFLSNKLTTVTACFHRMQLSLIILAKSCRMLPKFALFLIACCSFASHAFAALIFTNKTPAAIEIAVGYRTNQVWVSEGWWRVEPGLSVNIRVKRDKHDNLFYYATSRPPAGIAPQIWGGNVQFCISEEKAFRIRGNSSCENPHEEARGFARAPIKAGTHTYKLEFRDEAASKNEAPLQNKPR